MAMAFVMISFIAPPPLPVLALDDEISPPEPIVMGSFTLPYAAPPATPEEEFPPSPP
jgi:hypothetical protein